MHLKNKAVEVETGEQRLKVGDFNHGGLTMGGLLKLLQRFCSELQRFGAIEHRFFLIYAWAFELCDLILENCGIDGDRSPWPAFVAIN